MNADMINPRMRLDALRRLCCCETKHGHPGPDSSQGQHLLLSRHAAALHCDFPHKKNLRMFKKMITLPAKKRKQHGQQTSQHCRSGEARQPCIALRAAIFPVRAIADCGRRAAAAAERGAETAEGAGTSGPLLLVPPFFGAD
jgi:hypothetical protein